MLKNKMNWYSKYSQKSFYTTPQPKLDDLFGNETKKKEVNKDAPSTKNITLQLYRGFDADLSHLEKSGQNYILSPVKCEQGLLWFSRNIRDAQGRGKYILEYQLQCIKHFQTIKYNDGSSYEQVPQEILDKSNPTENSNIWQGIELPDGWFWSYKTEKHIVCSKNIVVSPNMIKLDNSSEE